MPENSKRMEISIKLHKSLSDDADFAYTKQSTDGAIINDFGVFFSSTHELN